jgi:LysR family transcriptional regulator, carnitine catabolism transcriptional activator
LHANAGLVVNLVDTQIALGEAGEGIAILPSFGLALCRYRKVAMNRLIDPVVNLDFYQISNRGKKLPPGADEFTALLKTYIAKWDGPWSALLATGAYLLQESIPRRR